MGKKSKKSPAAGSPIPEEEQKLTQGLPATEETANGHQHQHQDQQQQEPRPVSQAKSHKSAEYEANMLLFTEDQGEGSGRHTAASFLSRIADLNSLPPTMDPEAAVNVEQKKGADLGTVFGVYLPCIQNILGVIIFIRMVWIVGTAGVPLAFLVVLICCMVTFTTSISLSAIATNGIVPAGGSYFMISRALGPEFGGAVGILFFLGTSVAGAMYITGAVEIILNYMYPDAGLFGDFRKDPQILYHNIRVYGTGFVLLCSLLVYVGVKFVSKVAPIALVCVILSILSIYGGIFINYEGTPHEFCALGQRIMASSPEHCTDNETDPYSLLHRFCTWRGDPLRHPLLKHNATTTSRGRRGLVNVDHDTSVDHRFKTETWKHVVVNIRDKRKSKYENWDCDPYFLENDPHVERAVPGLQSGILQQNIPPRFGRKGDVISLDDPTYDDKKPKYANILIDITTSFTMFVGIYFPSCTGILAGSNRSGDLADGQKSIPAGTLAAQLTTSFIYLSSVILFGASFNNLFIRDKFGESMDGTLAVTLIAWPYPFLIVVGSLLSTLGAALQSLTSAPRLLQAIAQDNIIPFLNPFAHIDSRGEPVRALAVTVIIAEVAVLIGNLDFIAPILTMFFLMCYMFVNLACTLQSLLRTPNWRPRWKFYHWSFSLVGVFLCLFVMFISAWHIALFSMFLAGCFYKYIEYRGAEKEWGDGFRGLALSAARFSLLRLEDGPPHTKNWRPQILVFVAINESTLDASRDRKILTFASQLKAGKGLTLVGTILEGELRQRHHEVQAAKQSLRKLMNQERVKGFADVLVAHSLTDGLCYFIQVSGLAGLKPNTVILGWPRNWKSGRNGARKTKMFLETVRSVTSCRQHALLVPKGYENWPDSTDKMGGTIDIWWIVLDGGLLMLIPFLLKQHRTWKNAKLRIFTVAQLEDNSIQMKKDLATWVYALRIDAEVDVVELQETDLSGYAYERTLRMEQRSEIMKHLNAESGSHADRSDSEAAVASGILSPGDVTPAYGSAGRGRRMSRTSIAIEQLLKETKGIKEAREALAATESDKQPTSGPTSSVTGSPSEVVRGTTATTVRYTTSTAAAAAAERKAAGHESSPVSASSVSGSVDEKSGEVSSSIKGSKVVDAAAGVVPVTSSSGTSTTGTVVEIQAATPEPSPSREHAPEEIGKQSEKKPSTAFAANLLSLKPDEANVRRMHTAVKLNQVIHDRSHASKLVVLNLPGMPKAVSPETEHHYMEFIEALTEGLDRVLLIRGAGREVITIYS